MRLPFTLLLALLFGTAIAQEKPELRQADKVRIREAINIAAVYGDRLFEKFSEVPLTILLVTDSFEFLAYHPEPSADFTLLGWDDLLQTNLYFRKTRFPTHLLATFPAVNGRSCIVVGTPENTNKHSTAWIMTLLHEHFHQYQQAHPDYYASVDGLNLSGGDLSGRWMLDYPFPYEDKAVGKQYDAYTRALYTTITNLGTSAYTTSLKGYLSARAKLKRLLGEADYRYLSFQIWQEGLARHAEYSLLRLLDSYVPSQAVRALPDFVSFPVLKRTMYEQEIKQLKDGRLQDAKRVSFYALGFAEGILLDHLNKGWRQQYLTDKFYIEKYASAYK